MQRRLIASIVGAVVGLCVASRLQDAFDVSATVAYSGAAVVGIALGYVASTLFDVFAGSAHSGTTPE